MNLKRQRQQTAVGDGAAGRGVLHHRLPVRDDDDEQQHRGEDEDEQYDDDENDDAKNGNENDGVVRVDGGANDDVPLTSRTKLYCLCAALNSCNLGYDLGASTFAGPLIQQTMQLSDDQLELFLGSLNFWSIGGALISPFVSDRFGRRPTFAVAAVGFLVGIVLQVSAQTYGTLMFGRFVVGLGVGVGEAIDPMYISEFAPRKRRGELVSWAEAGVALGVVLGLSSSLLFLNSTDLDWNWRWMVGLGGIMPCVMLVLVWRVMPESPRWLLTQNCDDEAASVLRKTHPPGWDVRRVANEIQSSLELERAASRAVGWRAVLWDPSPSVRRMLLVGIGIAIIQQASGIDAVMFYLMFVIRGAGITSELGETLAVIALGVTKLVFVFVGARLIDTMGRRPLLFTSLLGCAASLLLVSATISTGTEASEASVVVGLALYLAFFSSGLGPGNWVVVSEVFATSIRAKAMSVAVLPNRITATIMASTFLSVATAMSWPGFFALLAGICCAGCAFLFVYLPETKGKSLEEMSSYFAEITGDRSILDVEEQLKSRGKGESQQQAQAQASVEMTRQFTIDEGDEGEEGEEEERVIV